MGEPFDFIITRDHQVYNYNWGIVSETLIGALRANKRWTDSMNLDATYAYETEAGSIAEHGWGGSIDWSDPNPFEWDDTIQG